MSALDHEPFPRGALIAAFAVVGVSLTATAAVRLERIITPPPIAAPQPAPAASIDLRFTDLPDGSVRIQESGTSRMIETVQPGVGGFIRGVMRGLAHDRIRRHIGAALPFRLSKSWDGQLTLTDTATGRVIDLESFGSGNRASFLELLAPREAHG